MIFSIISNRNQRETLLLKGIFIMCKLSNRRKIFKWKSRDSMLCFLPKNFAMHFYDGVQVHSRTRLIIRRRTRKFPSGLERDSAPIRGGNRAWGKQVKVSRDWILAVTFHVIIKCNLIIVLPKSDQIRVDLNRFRIILNNHYR